jgi:hypothetical protein
MGRSHLTSFFAVAIGLLFATSSQAFSFYDTGVSGGSPSDSLLGVSITAADVGSSFDLDWKVSLSGDWLYATATYDVIAFDSSSLTLGISLTNNTVLSSTLTNADILSIGFGVSPDATATFLSSGSVFDNVSTGSGPNQTAPGGFKDIDVCLYGQNCTGGAVAQGLHAGDSDSLTLSLAGDFSGGSVDLLYFPMKFQTNLGSYEPGGSLVPEPSGALLFGVGLLLARAPLRRRLRS